MDGVQHINQHDLTVDLGKVVAEERFHDAGFIRLKPPLHFAPQAFARGVRLFGQGGECQHRAARQIAGQQEPPRRTVGKARLARGVQVVGKGIGQSAGAGFGQIGGAVFGVCQRQKFGAFGPLGQAGQRFLAPFHVRFVQQRQIQQPFARIIDDIQMHGARPLDAAQNARRLHLQRKTQFRHRAGAVGPVRAG